jgi:NAD(P)H-hydrate epimerase
MSHKLLQHSLFRAKTIREIDMLATQGSEISAFELMSRAGESAFSELLDAFGIPSLLHVFCGSGNNGGDGYIVASLAAAKSIPVHLYEFGNTKSMSKEAIKARRLCLEAKINCQEFQTSFQLSEGVIVDGLIGIGYEGKMRKDFVDAIECINSSLLPVLSIDLPSGLISDTGAISEIAVRADLTVTFVGAKQGLFTGRGPALCGDIIYDSLEIPEDVFKQKSSASELMCLEDLMDFMPEMEADLHKNKRGHCMVIGGDYGAGGASLLAAQACLKVGAGLSSHATRPEHISASLMRQPEVMACGVVSGQELEPLLVKPSVLVVGPGLGRSSWSEQILQKALSANLPMVVDADGLNIISEGRVASDFSGRTWVMTPHPGEAARLLGTTIDEIESDRFSAVSRLQEKYNAIIVLKGAGTIVSAPHGQPNKVCQYGNPAMATAGMGDILSGIIGGLIAQGLDIQTATELGVCMHSFAADMAVDADGSKGLVAGDLFTYLRDLLNLQNYDLG